MKSQYATVIDNMSKSMNLKHFSACGALDAQSESCVGRVEYL